MRILLFVVVPNSFQYSLYTGCSFSCLGCFFLVFQFVFRSLVGLDGIQWFVMVFSWVCFLVFVDLRTPFSNTLHFGFFTY